MKRGLSREPHPSPSPRTRFDARDPVVVLRLAVPGSLYFKSSEAARAAGITVDAWIRKTLKDATKDAGQ